jgi:hypothetical protein
MPLLENLRRNHWDEGEIVEILGVIALFGYLNRWNDSMGTSLETPGSRKWPAVPGGTWLDWGKTRMSVDLVKCGFGDLGCPSLVFYPHSQ